MWEADDECVCANLCVCVRKTLGGGATAVTTAVLQSPMMHLGISHSYYDFYSPVLYPLLLSLNTCPVSPHTVPLQMKEDVGCCKVSLFNLASELVHLACFGNILENMCCWNVNIVKLSSIFHKIVFPPFHLVTLVVHKITRFTVHHNFQYSLERKDRQWKPFLVWIAQGQNNRVTFKWGTGRKSALKRNREGERGDMGSIFICSSFSCITSFYLSHLWCVSGSKAFHCQPCHSDYIKV